MFIIPERSNTVNSSGLRTEIAQLYRSTWALDSGIAQYQLEASERDWKAGGIRCRRQ